MDYLTTREPEEMSLSTYTKHTKRQGAELLCNVLESRTEPHGGRAFV